MTRTVAARSCGLALMVLCSATLMIILDGTIVTVALPSIQRGLRFPPPDLTWVMNAYMIAFGSLLLLAGRLGDLIGRKRMFLAGMAVFTLASAACGLSGGPQMLIAARFARGRRWRHGVGGEPGCTAHLRAAGLDTSSALTGGYHLAFGIAACLAAAALVVALTVPRPGRPRRPVRRNRQAQPHGFHDRGGLDAVSALDPPRS